MRSAQHVLHALRLHTVLVISYMAGVDCLPGPSEHAPIAHLHGCCLKMHLLSPQPHQQRHLCTEAVVLRCGSVALLRAAPLSTAVSFPASMARNWSLKAPAVCCGVRLTDAVGASGSDACGRDWQRCAAGRCCGGGVAATSLTCRRCCAAAYEQDAAAAVAAPGSGHAGRTLTALLTDWTAAEGCRALAAGLANCDASFGPCWLSRCGAARTARSPSSPSDSSVLLSGAATAAAVASNHAAGLNTKGGLSRPLLDSKPYSGAAAGACCTIALVRGAAAR